MERGKKQMLSIQNKLNCGLSYIAQTGIEKRLKEHEGNVRFKQINKSGVAENIITQGHNIEWEKTTLLHNNHK